MSNSVTNIPQNAGKIFEKNIKDSCGKDIFFYRIKDAYVPYKFRKFVPISPNDFDCFIYAEPNLFCLELKSTLGASLSFDESIVKEHQIKHLLSASIYSGMICGLVINFRSNNNRTFFVEINDYLAYKHVAQNRIKDHKYRSKVNRSSIPIGICEEIGIEIKNELKRIHHKYFITDFIQQANQRFGSLASKNAVDFDAIHDMEVEFDDRYENNYELAEWARNYVPDLFEIIHQK